MTPSKKSAPRLFKTFASLLLCSFALTAFTPAARAQATDPFVSFIAVSDTNGQPFVGTITNATAGTNVVAAASFSNSVPQPFLIRPGYGISLETSFSNSVHASGGTSNAYFYLQFLVDSTNILHTNNGVITGVGSIPTVYDFIWGPLTNNGNTNVTYHTNLPPSLLEGYYAVNLMGVSNQDALGVITLYGASNYFKMSRRVPWATSWSGR